MILDRALVIGIILFQNVTTLDFMGPATYLEMIQPMLGQKTDFYTISDKVGGPIQPSYLMPLHASVTMEEAPRKWDILIIPGGPGATPYAKNEKLVSYARAAAENATDVLTVCTGGRILGATGLLDGKSATTNKIRFNEIAATYPNVKWVPHARWVEDGKWWTSSGVSAGLDMGHAYVAKKFGAEAATRIARTIEYVATTDGSEDPFAEITTGSPAPAASLPPVSAEAPIRVGVILFNNVTTLDFMGPATYLEFIQTMLGRKVEFTAIAEKAGAVQPLNLVPLHATVSMDQASQEWDILIIPGGPGAIPFAKNEKLVSYVRGAAEKSKDVLTVCTGGRILGATGLIDGKKATTNKLRFKEIAKDFPKVNWIEKARWVEDGKWWTSSGVSAGLDMGHAYVTAKFGKAVAERIARTIEYVADTDSLNDPFVSSVTASPAPLPGSGSPAPSTGTPTPGVPSPSSGAPATSVPGASSAAPAPSSGAPVPTTGAPLPSSGVPAPLPSATTAPGTPAPSTDLPGVVKPNPGATTCVRGSQGRKDLDAWCTSNCAMNFCPQSHCEPCA
ncbi:hypothetical protein Poli38472_005018 [Pythium oligandrum]|uniref:DJ-1/PfpI domain-containing protein n=1 Tax=Pythium oligandrum TaxID=41045 RepID=A0A8K1CAU7_PYTOL|nr:hypothetical protein Poli38472_005018 [Pythium oligandrum]|eukprot:TMW59949.1 hypothetical protein Poli38472_005018 [Pythium oligandrum]